jgi:hypothetical protein
VGDFLPCRLHPFDGCRKENVSACPIPQGISNDSGVEAQLAAEPDELEIAVGHPSAGAIRGRTRFLLAGRAGPVASIPPSIRLAAVDQFLAAHRFEVMLY